MKIWFQNRRARERRDKNSPPVLEKELVSAANHPHHHHPSFTDLHPNHHLPHHPLQDLTPTTSNPSPTAAETRLIFGGKTSFPGGADEQLKAAIGSPTNPYNNVNLLHTTPWGNMYHAVHGLLGLRPLGVQYYDSNSQRAAALAHHRMLALQRHSAFTPVVQTPNNRTLAPNTAE